MTEWLIIITNTSKTTRERRIKSKVSTRKEIINLTAEINGIETKKTTGKSKETKSIFFEKINQIDKPCTRLIKKKRERTQINKIRNKLWLVHVGIWQKPTEYYKAIILQSKINKFFKKEM